MYIVAATAVVSPYSTLLTLGESRKIQRLLNIRLLGCLVTLLMAA